MANHSYGCNVEVSHCCSRTELGSVWGSVNIENKTHSISQRWTLAFDCYYRNASTKPFVRSVISEGLTVGNEGAVKMSFL